jgi:hypothetical protein
MGSFETAVPAVFVAPAARRLGRRRPGGAIAQSFCRGDSDLRPRRRRAASLRERATIDAALLEDLMQRFALEL